MLFDLIDTDARTSLAFWFRFTSGSLMIGLMLSWRLFLSHDIVLPSTPLIPGFQFFDPLPVCILMMALGALLFSENTAARKILVSIAVASYCVACCGDVSRIQPWAVQYLLMLHALAFSSSPEGRFRLILAALYLWSGFHKLNSQFTTQIFPELVSPLLPECLGFTLPVVGAIAPFMEILLGFMTLISFPLAPFMALGMHSLILAALVARSTQLVMWPWQLMCIVIMIRVPNRANAIQAMKSSPFLTVFCFIMPVLFFAPSIYPHAWYPAALSWNMFGGNTLAAVYSANENTVTFMPENLRFFFVPRSQFFSANFDSLSVSGEYLANAFDYSAYMLGHPTSPERSVYVQFLKFICR